MREWYEMSWKDRLIDKLVAVIVIAGVMGLILIIGFCFLYMVLMLTGTVCNDKWSDYEHRYSITTGCLVRTDSGFVPDENVLVTDDGIIVTVES